MIAHLGVQEAEPFSVRGSLNAECADTELAQVLPSTNGSEETGIVCPLNSPGKGLLFGGQQQGVEKQGEGPSAQQMSVVLVCTSLFVQPEKSVFF